MRTRFLIKALPVLVGLGVVTFMGCGDDVTEVSVVNQPAMYFPEDDELPGCGKSEKNLLYYSEGLYFCNGKEWIALEGSQGEQGESGKNGTYCITESTGNGQKIVCDGDSVGIISATTIEFDTSITHIAAAGKQGKVGEDGPKGASGDACTVKKNKNGTYTQTCDGVKVTTYGAICGDSIYDPAGKKFCSGVTLYDKCGTEAYDLDKEFCEAKKVYIKCKGNTYDVTTNFCYLDSLYDFCGANPYNPAKQFCLVDSVYDKCGTATYDPTKLLCDDRDGQLYPFKKIGTQTWMTKNLNYFDTKQTPSLLGRSRCESCGTYGRHYTWAAAIDSVYLYETTTTKCGFDETSCEMPGRIRGICPKGWHLPSNGEWNTFLSYVSSSASNLRSTSGWAKSYNGAGDVNQFSYDKYGFTVLPAGFYNWSTSSFGNQRYVSYMWSKDVYSGRYAYAMRVYYAESNAGMYNQSTKANMNSIRCLRD